MVRTPRRFTRGIPPIPSGVLTPEQLRTIRKSPGWRSFEKEGETYWVQNRGLKRVASATKSFELNDGRAKMIDVVSLKKSFIHKSKNQGAGFTVIDHDKSNKPNLDSLTNIVGVVRTEKGWHVIQRGADYSGMRYQDPEYERQSYRRKAYNLRTSSRDGTNPRVLHVRSANMQDKDVKTLVNAWEKSGGLVKIIGATWRAWKLGD